MKVAIDVSPLKTGHQFRGVGFYTERLVDALSREAGSRFAGKSIKVPDFSVSTMGRSASGGQLIKKRKIPPDVDLVHYPYFEFFFLTLPFQKPKPTVVTIHDVTPLVFPDKYPKGVRGWLKLQAQKFSLRSVSALITDSKNSKKDIIKYLGFPKEKIYVVPLAPGKEFRPIESTKLLNSIKVKYDLPEKFILYAGDVNYNKNIPGLIKACKDISFPLVICGKQAVEIEDWKTDRSMLKGPRDWIRHFLGESHPELTHYRDLLRELKINKSIIRLGFVPTKDLVAIYNLATVYCQPSFYEGFGLPVLEAMACGCPVVAAKTSSLPEICGKAAVFVNPREIEEIKEGLIRVIGNDKFRRSLIRKGFSQAKKFTWRKTAEQTINVYQKVLAK